MPKGFKKNINIIRQPVGFEQRQGILDDIAYKGTFLPRGVMYEDMDSTFIEFVENFHKDLIEKIKTERAITDETEAQIKKVIVSFVENQK